jgi:hypothetical protein
MQAAEWLTARLMRSLPGLFAAKKIIRLSLARRHGKKLRAKVIQIDRH